MLLSRPVVGGFALNIASAMLAYVMHIVLARFLGAPAYGVFALSITWATLLIILAKLGLDSGIVRFAAQYDEHRDIGALKGLVTFSTQTTLAVSGLIFVVGYFVVNALVDGDTRYAYLMGLAIVPAWGILHILQATLRGLQQVPQHEVAERVVRPALVVLVIGTIWGLSAEDNLANAGIAVFVYLCTTVAAVFVAAAFLFRAWPKSTPGIETRQERKLWLATALPLAVVASLNLALANIDVIMIGAIEDPETAGVYSAAARVSVLTIFGLTAINAIAAPRIARLFLANDTPALAKLLRQVASGGTLSAVLIGGVVIILAENILGLFGDSFQAGERALVILIGAHIFNAACGGSGILLSMTGHERSAAWILVCAVLVNLGLNAVLIPHWGIDGAAWATAFSIVLWNTLMVIVARRSMKLDPSLLALLAANR